MKTAISKTYNVIKFIKNIPIHIKIPSFDLGSLEVHLYSDASFNNLPDGDSQGGCIVFICDKNNESTPIALNSSKLKSKLLNTSSRDTSSLGWMRHCLPYSESVERNIQAFFDSQSFHDAVKTANLTLD